jgi:hypothetical protein
VTKEHKMRDKREGLTQEDIDAVDAAIESEVEGLEVVVCDEREGLPVRTWEFSGSFKADAETAKAVKEIIESILNAVLVAEAPGG